MRKFDLKRVVGGGGSATHVAHCNNIHPYFGHWCDVLPLIGGRLFRMPRCQDAKRHSLLRLRKFDLNKKFFNILSLVKRNILISPLEGEKKILSDVWLKNFREGYNLKYSCRNSNSDLPKQLRCIPLNNF